MSLFPLPCVPSHSSLGTSSWLGTCTVADGTAKFSFQPDQLPGGVCNRTRQTLESAHEKWEAPLVPVAEALVTPKPPWKANAWLRGVANHCQQKVPPPPIPSSECLPLLPLSPPATGRIWAPAELHRQSQPRAGSSSPKKPPCHQDKPLEERPRRITRTQHRKNYSSKSHFYLLCLPLPRGISSGDSSWQLLKQTWCSAAKGFLKIQSEEILML